MRTLSPAKQLDAFLAKYDAPVATIARGALARMRKRLPGMFELVYDNYNALAIGFRPKPEVEALLSSALEIAGVRVDPMKRGKLVIRSVSGQQRPRRPTSAKRG